jgi:Mrp family chromosome partitioning ATPase
VSRLNALLPITFTLSARRYSGVVMRRSSRWWRVLRARWVLATAVAVVVCAAGLACVRLQATTYVASTSVQLRLASRAADTALATPQERSLLLEHEAEMRTEPLLRRLIADLRLDRRVDLRAAWIAEAGGSGDYHAWLLRWLAPRLQVQAQEGGGPWLLTAQASDPDLAAALANGWARAIQQEFAEQQAQAASPFDAYWQGRTDQLALRARQAKAQWEAFEARGRIYSDSGIDPVRQAALRDVLLAVLDAEAKAGRSVGATTASGEIAKSTLSDLQAYGNEAERLRLRSEVEQAQWALENAMTRARQQGAADGPARELQAPRLEVQVLQPASVPLAPSQRWSEPVQTGLALALGLALGLMAPWLRERRDPRARRLEDLSEGMKFDPVVVLPGAERASHKARDLQPADDPASCVAEAREDRVAPARSATDGEDSTPHDMDDLDPRAVTDVVDRLEAAQAASEVAGARPQRQPLPVLCLESPRSPQAEAMATLARRTLAAARRSQATLQAGGVSVAVLSADRNDGRSHVVANLAASLCREHQRVLIIDADLLHARQHRIWGVSGRRGLTRLLLGRAEGTLIQPVQHVPGLYLLAAGAVPTQRKPAELLRSPNFSMLLRELSVKFDVVIVDSPAVSDEAAALELVGRCDASLLVGRQDKTRLDAWAKLHDALRKSRTRVTGLVYNTAT